MIIIFILISIVLLVPVTQVLALDYNNTISYYNSLTNKINSLNSFMDCINGLDTQYEHHPTELEQHYIVDFCFTVSKQPN